MNGAGRRQKRKTVPQSSLRELRGRSGPSDLLRMRRSGWSFIPLIPPGMGCEPSLGRRDQAVRPYCRLSKHPPRRGLRSLCLPGPGEEGV